MVILVEKLWRKKLTDARKRGKMGRILKVISRFKYIANDRECINKYLANVLGYVFFMWFDQGRC